MQVVAEDRERQRVEATQAQKSHEEVHSGVPMSMGFNRDQPLFGVLLSQIVNAILLIHELRVEVLKVEQVNLEVVRRSTEQV